MKATWGDRWRNWWGLRSWQAKKIACRWLGHREQAFPTQYGSGGSIGEYGCGRCGAFPL